MTKEETKKILAILIRIKDPDGYIQECISICNKQLARWDKMRGQLRDQYESDWTGL